MTVSKGAWESWLDQEEPKSDWEIFWAEWNKKMKQDRLREACDDE